MRIRTWLGWLALCVVLSGCGGGSGSGEGAQQRGRYKLSGTVQGLIGSGLVLNNFSQETITVNANGSFTSTNTYIPGATYQVRLDTTGQPEAVLRSAQW